MNYAEWLSTVPPEITNDPIWKLELYRLALFAGDIGWKDIPEEKVLIAHVSSRFRSAQHVKAETGITNLDMFYPLRLSNIVWA